MSASVVLTAGDAAAELLARVLLAEAGHRGLAAVEGVASVALNRARCVMAGGEAEARFAGGEAAATLPRALIAVLRAPFQFPCRHPRHPRHGVFAAPPEGPALAMCRRVAARALAGGVPDATGGALRWHEEGRLPGWAVGRAPIAELGGLVFYG
ncbi:MAG: cell wall hydrolase [Acetobacteraceae bacterium]|nr:cell wall hydrolase [Acetobacteraceae bacterium]